MRADLLALTPDALAALTNRGLVKRAAKEVDAAPPAVTEEADGTVVAVFTDGPVTRLPAGGLATGTCTCGATGACRHLLALVLTYQRAAETGVAPQRTAEAGEPVGWSPGTFTDEQLQARIGARLMTAARRALRAGYLARVRRPTAADPAAQVDLGSATVRFLVPHDLGFVHTDAVAGARDDVLALAVWAFRAADERAPGAPEIQIEVGGTEPAAAEDGTGLAPAVAVASALLRDGAVHAGPGLASALAEARRGLDAAGLRWPLLAVADLAELLAAYRDRGAGYRPEALAELLVELHARDRTMRNGGSGLRSRVLGTEEAAETPLRRTRLESLGCRVSELGDDRTVEVFLAHADSTTVLVLRRTWTTGEDGPALARRRAGGVALGALAGGNVVTESAVRSASRVVRLATGRLAKTSATPSHGTWEQLPGGLFVGSYDEERRRLDALPPRPVRPRVEAELVRALAVAEVRDVVYSPGRQRLDALVADASGTLARIVAHHTSAAPGRLDALAAALTGDHGPVRLVSGGVRRSAGGLVIDPLAIAADGPIVVPDLTAPDGRADALPHGVIPSDPLADALTQAEGVLAEAAHRGLAHLPASFPDRLRAEATALTGLGLRRAADAIRHLADSLGPDPSDAAVTSWVDAALFVSTALELR
ncbi:hypothetical protein [Catenuloplanes atrovinosus]|uniref:SWIM-type domain-containing protein n=1 Tax=Catenuloplanes atrovinosus TaxID=137266 RepID=A0AAE3YU05_9ACTN|nr:hypothetical protein [Catenuloplanes atrovinosus]MDR7279874.1 hypothetical protein [Catenuloplanes atrovinosus]